MKKKCSKLLVITISGGIVAAFCVACTATNYRLAELKMPERIKDANYVGSKACVDCHEEVVNNFEQNNIHGRIAKFEIKANGLNSESCESCHGPGSKHVESGGDPCFILNPAKLSTGESASVCIQCHTDGDIMQWRDSKHAYQDMNCISCHTVHNTRDEKTDRDVLGYKRKHVKDASLKKTEPELCFECHSNVMVQTNYPNHHPIKEGKMLCSECHNPHGSQTKPMLRTDERKNELCLSCHMEYTGPYAFEHAPVTEDCTVCHNPHGTLSDNLLKQNEPFLCLQCHQLHFHTSFRPNPDEVPSNYRFKSGVPDDHSMQLAMMTRCTQCHSMVHGSDLPSLYTTGGGSRLTR